MDELRHPGDPCRGCGTPTATSILEEEPGEFARRVPLCPDCLGVVIDEPEARELVLSGSGSIAG